MKVAAFLSLLPAVLALPTATASDPAKRQTATALTDEILFSISLPAFLDRRAARNPPALNWESDSCSSSPDNPLGFPFTPACQRHDFGYRNYKAQNRFTSANRERIDKNFRAEYVPLLVERSRPSASAIHRARTRLTANPSLYFICSSEGRDEEVCRLTADVYYLAVRIFGRESVSASKIAAADSTGDVAAYHAAVEALGTAVARAKSQGRPSGDWGSPGR